MIYAGILDGISDVVSAVVQWIIDLFTSVSGLFWDTTLNSGAGGFTFIGVLLLVAFGLSMVWVVINFIRSLVKRG